MNSFQESFPVNCFLHYKKTVNFIKHSREPQQQKLTESDERGNLIAPAPAPQAKFVKFFTISSRLMLLISFNVLG